MNVTEPVGVMLEATVATNVTDVPLVEGFFEEVKLVTVVAGLITWFRSQSAMRRP